MPTRLFFDVSNGETTIRDEDGVEALDLDEALIEARDVIAEMADGMTDVDPSRSWTLIVRDEAGSVVGCLSIKP